MKKNMAMEIETDEIEKLKIIISNVISSRVRPKRAEQLYLLALNQLDIAIALIHEGNKYPDR